MGSTFNSFAKWEKVADWRLSTCKHILWSANHSFKCF